MKKNKLIDFTDDKMIIGYICMFFFIVLTILVLTKAIMPLNDLITSFVISIRGDNMTKVMLTITNIARAYSLIVISILLLFFIKDKKIPLKVCINLIVVFLSSQLLKIIFRQPRPDGLALTTASGFGYPSGHAMVSLAYFGYLTYLLCKKVKSKFIKTILIIICILLILLIGFSRIYLGVHYFSDVIAGFLLGTAYFMTFLTIIKAVDKK